jgi:predicted DsbA family dithiol-disulfide isomerase
VGMYVEIFSDVVCPWCAVGKRRFENALGRFAHPEEIEVVWRSFELDPQAPVRREGDNAQRLADKYGMTRQQAVAMQEKMTEMAAAEGLDFHFDRMQPGNTFDAHRLLHLALEQGPAVQGALKERLLVAYFSEGAPIGEPATLVRLAVDVGLDARACTGVLASDRYVREVRADEQEAHDLGVTGVPFFVVDSKFAIPGAQDPATILDVLNEAWQAAHPLHVATLRPGASTKDSPVCEGDSCVVCAALSLSSTESEQH